LLARIPYEMELEMAKFNQSTIVGRRKRKAYSTLHEVVEGLKFYHTWS